MKVASDSATIEISDETDSATGNKAEAVKLSINRPLGRGSCVAKHQLSGELYISRMLVNRFYPYILHCVAIYSAVYVLHSCTVRCMC